MVVATLTPSLGVFVMTILGIVAGTSMLLASLFSLAALWPDEPTGYVRPGAPDATSGVVMLTVYLCAALAVIIYQYRRRRWRAAIGLSVAGLAATVVVPLVWPWSFARGEEIRPGAWAAGVTAVHDPSWGTEVSDVDRFGRGVPRRHVNARVTLSGVPPEVTVQSVGVQGALRFPDGTVIESSQSGGFGSSFMTTTLEAALGGIELLNPLEVFDQHRAWLPMVTLTEDEFLRYRGRPGRLTATVDFHLIRTREVGTLPVTPGAALDDGVSRLEVVAVRRRADSRGITVRRWRAQSPLSTERQTYQRWYALRHRTRGEALMGSVETQWPMSGRGNAALALLGVPFREMGMGVGISIASEGGGGGGGFSAATEFLRFPGRSSGEAPRLAEAWYDGTEIVVIEAAPDGVVTRPLTIDNFVIPGP
jgi:hypothetical protein